MIVAVRSARRENQDQPESQATLGDLLYTKKAGLPVSEKDWVRLVESVAGGDELALHSLYERTHRLVFTLAVRITNNRETAEEVTLDVFHDVWRRARAYDPAGGSVVGWIMNQARSRAIDRLRFDQRKKRTGGDAGTSVSPAEMHDPQEVFHLEEQTRLLRDAFAVLTAEERQVIETAFFSELTYQEAAAKLNQPIGTVKTRIRSGLGKLREALSRKMEGN
jgi:RNA polymerase sigma-70 factor, ECF subfamily